MRLYCLIRNIKTYFNKENFIHFSDLKTDFDKSAQRIAKVLKLNPLTDDELLVIKEKTSIANMRDDILKVKLNIILR